MHNLQKTQVTKSRKKLNLSNMPPGMVNTLTKKQILDLVAYLLK